MLPAAQHTAAANQGAEAAAPAPEEQPCPRCGQAEFNYEDLYEGTTLVCRECGFVVDEPQLVHQRETNAEGGFVATTWVSAAGGDGQAAGAALHGAHAPLELRRQRDAVLATARQRLDAGLSVLRAPPHVSATARQLLPAAIAAYAAGEQQQHDGDGGGGVRIPVTPAVVAAVVYVAARQERYALSFGAAAAALSTPGSSVFHEYQRIRRLLELEPLSPSLEACVVYAASVLLPQYLPGLQAGTPLRAQPVMQAALQLARLVGSTGAAEGRSPWVASGAVLAICLAAHFGDAGPGVYAREVAERLQHGLLAVQAHIRQYEVQLAPLLALLPYSSDGDGGVAVQVARNASVLLKLQELSRGSSSAAAAGAAGAGAAGGGGGGGGGGTRQQRAAPAGEQRRPGD